ncbi:MAG TPA: dienelactone hydrolase family protein [Thermoanaerobaculia bacterium]|jgi:dienelactone hydrolase
MFRWIVALALVGLASRCAQPHCTDRKPQVEPTVQEAAFPPPMTMRGATREFLVFRRGSGPPVVVFHEIPGLSPATLRLAHRISEAGFSVYVPLLFGQPGDFAPTRNFLKLCVGGGEIDCFNPESSGRIAAELKPLLLQIDADSGGKGLGAIGLCLTGTLPLELIGMDVPINAAVVAQPALPFYRPATLPLPEGTLDRIRERGTPILATRFSEDRRSPRARLDALKAALPRQVEAVEIDSGPNNPFGFTRRSHAVLTSWYCDNPGHPTRDVLERAITMFRNTSR